MKTVKIELNQYYRDQFLDNPQLFETNVMEEFHPYLETYRVVIKKQLGYNFMLLTVVLHEGRGEYERTRFGRLSTVVK